MHASHRTIARAHRATMRVRIAIIMRETIHGTIGIITAAIGATKRITL